MLSTNLVADAKRTQTYFLGPFFPTPSFSLCEGHQPPVLFVTLLRQSRHRGLEG